MMLSPCKRREDVASMVRMGYWPDGCDEELRAHIANCNGCKEWTLLTQSFQQARLESVEQARVSSSFLLWWKAELRRRDSALRQVRRPMMLAQGFALVTAIVAAPGFLIVEWDQIRNWFAPGEGQRVFAELQANLPSLLAWLGPGSNLMLLALGLVAVGLLGGVVYLASDGR